jgi:integrase
MGVYFMEKNIISISKGTIYNNRPHVWTAQVLVTYADGTTARKSITSTTEKKAKRALGTFKKALINGVEYIPPKKREKKQDKPQEEPPKHNYVDYLTSSWLEEKKMEGLTNSSLWAHRQRIESYITDFFYNMNIEDIQPRDIVNFYQFLLSKKIKPITVKKFSDVINNSFKFLMRDGMVEKNPCQWVSVPKITHVERRSLKKEEIKKLLDCCRQYESNDKNKNKNIYIFVKLALASGCRRGELCGLLWENVDFQNNKIKIKYSLEEVRGKCALKTPKTDKPRTISITPDVMQELQEHRKNFATGKYVFPATTDKNTPISPSSMYHTFVKVRQEAGMDYGLHELRHTHATLLADAGTPMHVVRDRLGHCSLSTTMNYYIHSNEELDRQASALFNDL